MLPTLLLLFLFVAVSLFFVAVAYMIIGVFVILPVIAPFVQLQASPGDVQANPSCPSQNFSRALISFHQTKSGPSTTKPPNDNTTQMRESNMVQTVCMKS